MDFTPVMDTYWRFAHERQQIYFRRLQDSVGPWTDDEILERFRFTNAYRAADRVSQYLIRHVQYRDERSQAPEQLFFRTLVFKIFNKIETWEHLERHLGPLVWGRTSLDDMNHVLDELLAAGRSVYSAAYIMPSPLLGHVRKHSNHLALIQSMMANALPAAVASASSLKEVFQLLLPYKGLGPFLAFQYAIDLNYSNLLDFEEADFVVAGPGALDGISKCIIGGHGRSAEFIIHEITDRQEAEFSRLGLPFENLGGRRLQPIDCQNLFCEISKYARVAHPEWPGLSGRTRIKQHYKASRRPSDLPMFPPRWQVKLQHAHEPLRQQRQLTFTLEA